MSTNRRKFLRHIAQAAAGLSLASLPSYADMSSFYAFKGKKEKKVRIGLIGCKNMGWANLQSVLKNKEVECTALCDVDDNILKRRAVELEKRWDQKPLCYHNYRELLANKDIDAVIIGTPDHWHCLQMIEACEAGKDVYVEKPIANTIEECKIMLAAVKKYDRIVQVGQWQRSDPHWLNALEYVHSGKLGKIRTVRAWAYVAYGKNIPVLPDEAAPQGVDYDLWLGPAPKRPFNKNRFHGGFRNFWDYGGGLMTDWGVHMIDMVLAGMKVDIANSVVANGGKYAYPNSAPETPDTLQSIYDFGDFSMFWEHALGTGTGPYNRPPGEPGVAFVGTLGTLIVDREIWEVVPERNNGKNLTDSVAQQTKKSNGLDHHTKNWIECIRSRQQPNCTVAMGCNAAINAHMGNVAYRTGNKIRWNRDLESIIGDNEAQYLSKATYRKPWRLPHF